MAPHPLLLSWSSPSPPTIAHYNGTLQWHHVHSPKIGRHPSPLQCSAMTTSTPPKLVVSLPYPHHSTLGTQQWHHVHSPKIGRHHAPTIAHSNSTLQWALGMAPTSTAPCNGTLLPHPIRQSGSSPSPFIGTKNPDSYRYLGKKFAVGISTFKCI